MDCKDDAKLLIEEESKENKNVEVRILFLNLTNCSKVIQFSVATACLFVFYISNGYYLELIYTSAEVKRINVYVTFVDSSLITTYCYVESLLRNTTHSNTPIYSYMGLAAIAIGTIACTNNALTHINYPTTIIFKSCNLVLVMVGSTVILGKKYGFLDYLAAVIMGIGLTVFILADSTISPHFNTAGVAIILVAVICDSTIGSVQEKLMKQYQSTNNEMMLFSFAFGSLYLLAYVCVTGVFWEGFHYFSEKPLVRYGNIVMLSMTSYSGMQAVLTLLRVAGAPVTVMVNTMRKAFSIALSFIIFSKPFVMLYVWSGLLILFAIFLNVYSQKHPNYVPPFLKHSCERQTSLLREGNSIQQFKKAECVPEIS